MLIHTLDRIFYIPTDGRYIYCLIDPRTNDPYYVGQTNQPENRLYTHVKTSGLPFGAGNGLATWLKTKEILDSGSYPEMLLLCVVPKWDVSFEKKVIKHFIKVGFHLTNRLYPE